MNSTKRKYLYYILEFPYIKNNNLYTIIRDFLYKNVDYDIDALYKMCILYKPLTEKKYFMTYNEFIRNNKLISLGI